MPPIAECECGVRSPKLRHKDLNTWREKHVREKHTGDETSVMEMMIFDDNDRLIGHAVTSLIHGHVIDSTYIKESTDEGVGTSRIEGILQKVN